MSEIVQYFAYGANRDPKMMSWITGRPETEFSGKPAVLGGFTLAVQRLDQVPDEILPTAPVPKSPREVLGDSWDESFRSYVITRAADKEVSGVIYELTDDERERVRDWELIDFGWYKDDHVTVRTSDGQDVPVTIERMGDGQQFDHEVDGLRYETWLNPVELFEKVAGEARLEYDQRLHDPEGMQPTTP